MNLKLVSLTVLSLGLFGCQSIMHLAQEEAPLPVNLADQLRTESARPVLGCAYLTGDEKLVDNPADIWMTKSQGVQGRALNVPRYRQNWKEFDTTEARRGHFSVVYAVDAKRPTAFGFTPSRYMDCWQLDQDFILSFQMKVRAGQQAKVWTLALYDRSKKRAEYRLAGVKADGSWQTFQVKLGELTAFRGFDFGSLASLQLEVSLPVGARIWLDDMVFRKGKATLGITDKSITQFMGDAAKTLARRRHEGQSLKRRGLSSEAFMGELYAGENLEALNRDIMADMARKREKKTYWDLWIGSALNWRLFGYGSKGRIRPGMLTAEAEKDMLDYYWNHCQYTNDMATARRSTWNESGSENHDICVKHEALLSSQIFKDHPDYANRIYPDLGRMAGYRYGDNPEFSTRGKIMAMKLGSGNYKDGNTYTAKDHYKAWVAFWKEYFAERARHGFFVEHNANGYMSHTGRFVHDIYAWCEDQELRRQTRMFLDLMWAQWAQDQLMLFQGGSATRGTPGYHRMTEMAQYFLGGPSWNCPLFYSYSDYQWPRVIWEMVLDRAGEGEYAFVSRKPNEVRQPELQEPGSEYTIQVRHDSRLRRYSWVTPDYVLGMRQDHPQALYHHLYFPGEGIIFATDRDTDIQFKSLVSLAVQDRNVCLWVPKRNFIVQSPDWFPGVGPWELSDYHSRLVFGKDLKNIVERDGWVFVEEGNAYAAIRMVAPVCEQAKTAKERLEGTMMRAVTSVYDEQGFGVYQPALKPYVMKEGEGRGKGTRIMESIAPVTPVVIEMGRRETYPTFEAFQKAILGNRIVIKQIINGQFIVEYRGLGKDAKLLTLNAGSQVTPMVDGKPIDYNCPTFDSPYLKGAFGSGVVTLIGPISGEKLILDFNRIRRSVEK